MRITKKVDFCAAHSIAGAGKCANKHGHNWEAIIKVDAFDPVTDKTPQLDSRGFILDVRDLKQTAYQYDHDDLDKYFEIASTENIAQKIADDASELCKKTNPNNYYDVHVTLIETKNNSADAFASYYPSNKNDFGGLVNELFNGRIKA